MDNDPKSNVFASAAPAPEATPSTLPTRRARKDGQAPQTDSAPTAEVAPAPDGANAEMTAEYEAASAQVIAPETPEAPPTLAAPEVAEPAATAQEIAEQLASESAAPAIKARPAWLRVIWAILAARWLLAIPAIPLVLYGGWLIEESRISPIRSDSTPPLIGWQLIIAGGVLLALAAFSVRPLFPSGPSNFIKNVRTQSGRQRLLFFGLLALAIICALAAVPLFWLLNEMTPTLPANIIVENWPVNTGSWLLYIASLVLFGLAFVVWERTTKPPQEGPDPSPPADRLPRWLWWATIVVLFAVSLFVRVDNLENVPPGLWFDEAQNGIVGRQLVDPNGVHFTFITDYTQMGALYFYVVGLLVKLMGNIVVPLRLIPAVSGALVVSMIFVLASRLYGWRVGLAAAGLLSINAWNITFSRFGMASLGTVALDVAVFLCMAQALRTGRLGYYAAGGVIMGLALQGYYVARLVPIILAALLLHKLITERMRLVRSIRMGVVVFAIGALMAFSPVGLFALQRPADYNGRPEIVSVFSPMNSPDQFALERNLNHNLQRHWLMFNWVGDGNGRHNLGGTPNLDWMTAALFFAGLAACVVRAWRWQYVFPVVWFLAAASGGVLTLPFEAPQSHRTLENSIVTCLLAGIFLGEVWAVLAGAPMVERIGRLFGFFRRRAPVPLVGARHASPLRPLRGLQIAPRPRRWPMRIAWAVSAAALLLAVVWVGNTNLNKYFQIQMKDLSVWKDMGARESQAAILTKRYGPDYDVYVAPVLKGLPPTQYLAPEVMTLDWPGAQILPLSSGKASGAVIILDLASAADVGMIARMYPGATFEIFATPSNPEPLLTTIVIPASDIEAAHGVQAEILQAGSNEPASSQRLNDFSFDWSQAQGGPGTVRLSSSFKVEQYGLYRFDWRNEGQPQSPAELSVDGFPVSANQAITLETGLHTVVATNTVESKAGVVRLLWAPQDSQMSVLPAANLFDPSKIQPRGLTAHIRPGTTFEGPPTTGRIDSVISFYFHVTPLPRPYTILWKGKLYTPEAGVYTLGTEQLSTSRLFVDGQERIVNGNINNLMEAQIDFTAGFHDIEIQFTDLDNSSHMYLYWIPPGKPRSIIPSAFLFPVMGEYPEPGSEGLATLADSDGSVLPEDRVIMTTPRTDGQEQGQNQSQPPQPQPQPQPQGGGEPQPETPLQGQNIKALFTIGDKEVSLNRPKAAAADDAGNIYIYTEGDSQLRKFDPQGNHIKSWEVRGAEEKPVTEGSALIVSGDRLRLFDAITSEIANYTLEGEYQGRTRICQCFYARGMSQASDGNYWIANTGGNQILKVDASGTGMRTAGEKGDQPGQFLEPASVWEAPDGTIFVADVGNSRVQALDQDFKPLAAWEIGVSVARDGNRLTGDNQSNVLVTQFEARAVVRYDKTGRELDRWVYRRGGDGAVPAGIAPLGDDRFIVLYPEVGMGVVFAPDE